MPRELQDIDVDEISLVDIPAIRKKFLIVKKDKKDMQKTSETDQDNSDIENLIKEEELMKINELIELYKKLTGDEEDFSEKETELMKKLSDEAVSAIKGALNILNKFKGDFSEELKDAVGVLAKYVTKAYPYPYPAKKSDEDLEKAGRKISKDTLAAIKKAIKILNEVFSKGDDTKKAISILSDLLSDEEKKALKKTDEEKERADKEKERADKEKERDEKFDSAIKGATETIEKLGKDLEEKDKNISELTKRLETLEKAKGTKKQIEGQDEDDGDGEVKKSDKPWPSFDFEIVEEDA